MKVEPHWILRGNAREVHVSTRRSAQNNTLACQLFFVAANRDVFRRETVSSTFSHP